jgi:hypothetical protein
MEGRPVLEREARGLGHRLVRLDEEVDGLLAVGPEDDGEEREPGDRLAVRLLDRPRQLDRDRRGAHGAEGAPDEDGELHRLVERREEEEPFRRADDARLGVGRGVGGEVVHTR